MHEVMYIIIIIFKVSTINFCRATRYGHLKVTTYVVKTISLDTCTGPPSIYGIDKLGEAPGVCSI